MELGNADVKFLGLFGIVSHTKSSSDGQRRQGHNNSIGMREGILIEVSYYGKIAVSLYPFASGIVHVPLT